MTTSNLKMVFAFAATLLCMSANVEATYPAPTTPAATPVSWVQSIKNSPWDFKTYVWSGASSYRDVAVKVAGIYALSNLAWNAGNMAYNWATSDEDNA